AVAYERRGVGEPHAHLAGAGERHHARDVFHVAVSVGVVVTLSENEPRHLAFLSSNGGAGGVGWAYTLLTPVLDLVSKGQMGNLTHGEYLPYQPLQPHHFPIRSSPRRHTSERYHRAPCRLARTGARRPSGPCGLGASCQASPG